MRTRGGRAVLAAVLLSGVVSGCDESKDGARYTIGGTIDGLTGTGLVLATPGQPSLPVPDGGTGFVFANRVADGTGYSVSVVQHPMGPRQGCSVTSGAGTVAGADVTNVTVTCRDSTSQMNALNLPRAFFTATSLGSLSVEDRCGLLVAGGRTAGAELPVTDAAEVFDPSTGQSTSVASMTAPRASACAALLPSGKVLVAGGSGAVGNTAEVYDPTTDTWTPTAHTLAAAHGFPACVTLGSGKVLVTGGSNQAGVGSTAVAEIYDPDTGLFTTTGPMATARYWHTATVLGSGQVLVTGGCTGGYPCTATTATAEVYDPDNGTWTATGALPLGVFGHSATMIDRIPSEGGGKVLVVGGCRSDAECGPEGTHTGGAEASAYLYDPATRAFAAAGAMSMGRVGHVVVPQQPGLLRIVGGTFDGTGGGTTDLYDPGSGTWAGGPPAAVDHGSYLGAAVMTCITTTGAHTGGGVHWYIAGGLGPWNGAYPFTDSIESGYLGGWD